MELKMIEYKTYEINEIALKIFEDKGTYTIKYFDEGTLICVFSSRPTSKLKEITEQLEEIAKRENERYFLTKHNKELKWRLQLTKDQKIRISQY